MSITPRFLPAAAVALCLFAAACGNCAAAAPAPAAPGGLDASVQGAVDQLATEIGPEKLKSATELLAAAGASAHASLGLAAFLGRNLEVATWAYGKGALANPANDVYWNNFGLGLHEKALLKKPTDPALLALARDSFLRATTLKPDNAKYQSNLGFALLELSRAGGDEAAAALQAAAEALQRATTLDPKSDTAWAHLAEVLAAKKDEDGALAAMEKSRAISPYNGALLSTGHRLPPTLLASYRIQLPKCKVDYQCKAKCPKSIIGQIDFVTCSIAESSAQSACAEGRPYAEAFDCSEQVPEFGILIPGLNSGFTLATPWGRIDVTVDGSGNVSYRVKAGPEYGRIGVETTVTGTWSPASGFAETEIKPGVSYSVFGGEAAKLANDMKMGPVQIVYERNPKSGETEMVVEVYGGAVFTH